MLTTVGVAFALLPAAAHPLDAYLQAAYLTPAPGAIRLELALSPGILVAPAALADLDPDGNHQVTTAEARAYADRIVNRLQAHVDDIPRPIALTSVDVPPYRTLQAGYGTVRLHATIPDAPSTPGPHVLVFRNNHAPPGAAYQVNALLTADAQVIHQQREAAQQQSRITYTLGRSTPVPCTGDASTPMECSQSMPSPARLAEIVQSRSLPPPVMLFALALAALLGVLHALTPGHGKTLMAAYLVGTGGRLRDALTLGAVVTFTHTASVIAVGLLALFASRFLLPGALVPTLEILSGALVVAVGAHMLRRRTTPHTHEPAVAAQTDPHAHGPHTAAAQTEPHEHGHAEQPHPAAHSEPRDHARANQPDTAAHQPARVTQRGLVAMGVSGGLVPCPEALGIMVLAVGVNRTVLGLGLIACFSLGVAAVLIGLGIALVRSRRLLARSNRLGPRWPARLALISALVVTALGTGLLVRGIGAALQ
ncbi:nickel/cobalt transporter [Paractinoplanes lichenicola]|uniref:Nickel/cobalt efflux system n=1 Tax=Paractinoplanes lichenicola TaxID=2802976 RepID=A0ABS1VME9_9ACTN|nr:hypothetical protein [Actinoplanes lichenicola]MBL7255907.1 hypothetical protein [Actinoplanes lichenicola]